MLVSDQAVQVASSFDREEITVIDVVIWSDIV